MKNIKIVIILFSVLQLLSVRNSSANYGILQQKQDKLDSSFCVDKIKSFLNWYKSKIDEIYDIKLLMIIKKDSDSIYRINLKSVDRFIANLKSSNYLTDNYLNIIREHFIQIDNKLVQKRQKDGLIEGLTQDLLLYSQEPKEYLNNISKLSFNIIQINDNLAVVNVKYFGIEVLFKLNSEYLIECIYQKKTPNFFYQCDCSGSA